MKAEVDLIEIDPDILLGLRSCHLLEYNLYWDCPLLVVQDDTQFLCKLFLLITILLFFTTSSLIFGSECLCNNSNIMLVFGCFAFSVYVLSEVMSNEADNMTSSSYFAVQSNRMKISNHQTISLVCK